MADFLFSFSFHCIILILCHFDVQKLSDFTMLCSQHSLYMWCPWRGAMYFILSEAIWFRSK